MLIGSQDGPLIMSNSDAAEITLFISAPFLISVSPQETESPSSQKFDRKYAYSVIFCDQTGLPGVTRKTPGVNELDIVHYSL